jgi:hypothetical protein
MIWPDSAADLPAPRDDEPAHLRQDIQDELADHLQSALEKELRRHTDEAAARERVLVKFGDPRRVARKLWQDAMWEKLMSQRVQLVASVLTLVVCAGMFCMTTVIANQGRAMNEAMLTRLDQIAKRSAIVPADPEWNPLSVHLASKSGEPLPEGFKVHMKCPGENASHGEPVNAAGVADFGLQRPGNYTFLVETPWGEFSYLTEKWVKAGSPAVLELTCPTGSDRVDAPLAIQWPESLDSADLCLVCEIKTAPRRLGGLCWGHEEMHQLLIDHSGRHMAASRALYDFPPPAPRTQATGAAAPTCCLPAPAPSCCAPPTLMTATTYQVPADLSANDKLDLPGYAEGTATVTVLRMQPGEGEHRIATPIGKPVQVRLVLHRGSSAHWKLTLPQIIEANAEKTADATATFSRTATR